MKFSYKKITEYLICANIPEEAWCGLQPYIDILFRFLSWSRWKDLIMSWLVLRTVIIWSIYATATKMFVCRIPSDWIRTSNGNWITLWIIKKWQVRKSGRKKNNTELGLCHFKIYECFMYTLFFLSPYSLMVII